jgi:hypothetical protein
MQLGGLLAGDGATQVHCGEVLTIAGVPYVVDWVGLRAFGDGPLVPIVDLTQLSISAGSAPITSGSWTRTSTRLTQRLTSNPAPGVPQTEHRVQSVRLGGGVKTTTAALIIAARIAAGLPIE